MTSFFRRAAATAFASIYFVLPAWSRLPDGTTVYATKMVNFCGEAAPVRVVFYQRIGESIGVAVLDLSGREITKNEDDSATLPLTEATGIYDLTGDRCPEIFLVGGAGAKTFEADAYTYSHGHLRKIGSWSGQGVRIQYMGGKPVIAITGESSLTNLYVWNRGKFIRANESFPNFYIPEIAGQRKILKNGGSLPAYMYSQACWLSAEALVYGRRYGEAEAICHEATKVVHTRERVIPSLRGSEEVLRADQRKADQEIERTLSLVAKARQKGANNLHQKTRPTELQIPRA
ncbi:MAG TPA: hypothetical protein VK473_06180 [Terriglobales bacterium]|nr:hypothetical protein [Terriglobales bacterium]